MIFLVIMLSVLMSIDAMAVGVAYGIKQVRIPLGSKLIIGCCSAVCGYISMLAGNLLAQVLPEAVGKWVGSGILFFLGIWFLIQNLRPCAEVKTKKTLAELAIKSLGITITIVRNPILCDMDQSGSIDRKESVVVGSALAMDILGAGLGLGIAKVSGWYMPLMVGFCQILFLYMGLFFGDHLGKVTKRFEAVTGILPGIIMISISIAKLFF